MYLGKKKHFIERNYKTFLINKPPFFDIGFNMLTPFLPKTVVEKVAL